MRASKIPAHFEVIRSSAAALWAQLDANEELAAPWRQMFRQVTQTPAHVVSELLQNADDAGATWARVFIEKGVFVLDTEFKDGDAQVAAADDTAAATGGTNVAGDCLDDATAGAATTWL